jgi:hypothetical protein
MNSSGPPIEESHSGRRPLLVWAIFVFYVYCVVSAAIGYQHGYFTLINGRRIPAPKTTAERAIRGAILSLAFLAAVELLRMRQAAIPLYTATWIARAMLTTYDVASASSGRHFVAVASISLIAFAAFTAVVAYAFWLHRNARLHYGL